MKLPAADGDLPRPLYFFDSYCVLCGGFVAFCLARDPEAQLSSPASGAGRRLRIHALGRGAARVPLPPWAVRWLRPLMLVPALLRNSIYDLIARNHYRWFGRRPSCFLPARSLHRSVSQPW